MDPIWLTIAFGLGFLVRLIGLPPLVGYLLAGFVLHYFGAQPGEFIQVVSDLGVTLLLFTVGLKLKFKSLIRKEIWGGASIHMLITTLVFGVLLMGMSYSSLTVFAQFDWRLALLIGFALSFSSTVYAVKVLEEKGEMGSLHGMVSIGILVMQDIFAVLFIVFAAGETPTLYALGLPVLLILIRPILFLVLKKIGHGEMLVLYGFFLALIVGAELFKWLGLKPDLGALVVGMLVAPHKKARELADALLQFKDFFLIGFFLSIGFMGIPNREIWIVAILLALAINFKVLLYFFVLTRFRLRARTSVFIALSLANFSEFGLIVANIAVADGLLPAQWLVTISIALSITFVISSPLNTYSHSIYYAIKKRLHVFETARRLTYDKTTDIGDAEILIFGMGRVGTATYDRLHLKYGQLVLGMDYNFEVVEKNQALGRNVVQDDATDSEFWERIAEDPRRSKQVKMIFLCMKDHKSNLFAVKRLNGIQYPGLIAAVASHEDQLRELEKLNVHAAYSIYTEAGFGFADHVCSKVDQQKQVESNPL